MNFRLLLAMFAVLLCSGCQISSNVNGDYVKVADQSFKRSVDGSVILTADQLEVLKSRREVTIIDRVFPAGGVAVTADELALLRGDKKLLAATLNNAPVEQREYAFLIKKGSLKGNLERLCAKFSTEHDTFSLSFEIDDLYVSRPKIIKSDSFANLLKLLISDYPAFASIH